uniref:Peptidase A1 domain-containing protein n=1 Tax=Ananas comosus var. bracteatus TaxID=296719 RepID=A0A6V7NWF8_ANACO|nr:unnamed protein product [Ananas comosus var. bracteatus]
MAEMILVSFLMMAPAIMLRSKSEGLRMALIHRYSIHSPLHSPNLSEVEMIQQLVEISDRRHSVAIEDALLPNRSYSSSSGCSTNGCAPCKQCFPQDSPMYRPSHSRTFHTLPCSHRLCAGLTCIRNMCFYKLTYVHTYLNMSVEIQTHYFSSETVNGVVFGCSYSSSPDMYPGSRAVGGIIGMGTGPRSFIRQLGSRAKGRFSYCLVSPHHNGTSHLRFGSDIERIKNAQTTRLLSDPATLHYHLDLKDLSIDGRLLHLPPNTFAPGRDWSGGCVLDSGSWLTYLTGTAFDTLAAVVLQEAEGFAAYPTIGFHFRGAVLRPKAANMFYIDEGSSKFCLFVKKRSQTLLGAVLQQNYRMVFDINKHKLTFAEENCARD